MGISKSNYFSKQQNDIANIMKAMAHPARIAILQYLLEKKTCICSDIVEGLPLAQATISQHLKELKKANIIQGQISGKSICYCINPLAFSEVKNFIEILITKKTIKS